LMLPFTPCKGHIGHSDSVEMSALKWWKLNQLYPMYCLVVKFCTCLIALSFALVTASSNVPSLAQLLKPKNCFLSLTTNWWTITETQTWIDYRLVPWLRWTVSCREGGLEWVWSRVS
jgi:hypothetical protein